MSDDLKDLNFKVGAELHRMFKVTAANWGMSMIDLFKKCFREWLEKHGPAPKDR
jgi:hypothetical protein